MAPLLDLEHIIDALQGFVRPVREGREAMKNLVVVGVKARTQQEIHVQALCVRTTKIHDEPVQIEVIIKNSASRVEEKIKSISCTCPAGASKEHSCKHAMATLIYLERHEEEDLEQLTCTDLEQKWGGLKEQTLSQFDPIPLKDFCHITCQQTPYRREVKEASKELLDKFRAMFLEDQPNSEAAVFLSCTRFHPADSSEALQEEELCSGLSLPSIISHALFNSSYILQRAMETGRELYLQCTPAEQKYFDEFVKIDDQDAVDMCVQTQDQCGELWQKFKFGRISGSICYSFFTYSRNKNPNWEKKLKATFQSTFKGNAHTERGLMYEADAKDCYERTRVGCKLAHPGFLVNPKVPWLGYSADGIISEGGNLIRLWECKTPAPGKTHGASSICSSLSYMGKENDGKLKEKHGYYGQVQLGMLLTSLPICDFTIYSYKFDEVYVDPVAFNEKFCLEMCNALTNVYFKYVLPWLCARQIESDSDSQ